MYVYVLHVSGTIYLSAYWEYTLRVVSGGKRGYGAVAALPRPPTEFHNKKKDYSSSQF